MLPRLRARRLLATLLALTGMVVLAACAGDETGSTDGGDGDSGTATDKGSVTISGQSFPEATLVATMYQQLLENAGYDVTMKLVDTRAVYMADGQFPGSIDIVPEYVGGFADYLNSQVNGSDAQSITSNDVQETLEKVGPLAEQQGISLLDPAEATDQNAFFVTKEYAASNDLATLSDLGALGKPVVLAAAPDCKGRTDCAGGLTEVYGIDISKVLPLGYASAQTYESVKNGESQLGETSTTDGSLAEQGFTLLADDKGIQPAQNLIPAVSTEFLKAHPDVKQILNGLMAKLTTEDLTRMNGEMGNERKQPADVAKAYLEDQGLL